jgi:hypothetical protein
VSGLQRNRYGVMDNGAVKPLESLTPSVRQFVIHEERRQTALAAELGFDEERRWRAYWLLQVYDTISLYLGLADLANDETTLTAPAQRLTITSTADPWTVRCAPFPFETAPARFLMRRRVLGNREWSDEPSFRADFREAPVELVTISLIAGGDRS